MRVAVIAVGERPPVWVREAWADYAKRLPRPYTPELIEVAAGNRTGARDPARAIADEGKRVLAALGRSARLVLLDERGSAWSSAELARRLARWAQAGEDIAFAIGGPYGHAPELDARAAERWSLSALTLPHALVRVVLIEQLYRAWSINAGHPYHRA